MISLYLFQLPFKKPFKTGKEAYINRDGLIIRFQDVTVDAISEASPLPGFSTNSLDDVREFLTKNIASLTTFFESVYNVDDLHKKLASLPESPTLQFALSTLGVEIICQRENIPLSELFETPLNSPVKVNAVAGSGSPEELFNQIRQGVTDGFSVFKVKVGSDLNQLPKTLTAIQNEFPGITFRLDANGSWPIDDLSINSKAFNDLPIEYIEEPASYESEEELNRMLNECSIPVALDESLKGIESIHYHSPNQRVEIFVIKPQLFGSILNLFVTFHQHNHLINRCVFTTLLESAAGRNITGVLAGLCGSTTRAHGLNTGMLFDADISDDLPIKNGHIHFEETIGFGCRFKDLHQKMLTKVV